MSIENIVGGNNKESSEESEYIVYLPDVKLQGIAGSTYSNIPRYGTTTAKSEKQAVSFYIMRYCESVEEYGKDILHQLKKDHGGLDNYAVAIPIITDNGQEIKGHEKHKLLPGLVANELASKEGKTLPEQRHYDRASFLLSKVKR